MRRDNLIGEGLLLHRAAVQEFAMNDGFNLKVRSDDLDDLVDAQHVGERGEDIAAEFEAIVGPQISATNIGKSEAIVFAMFTVRFNKRRATVCVTESMDQV